MTFNFLNQGQNTNITKVTPIDTFIDPVSKIRVSNPGNLIDTDFEYGLQPTKWETVEIINNTPAFFSKSGDTTISDITNISTNAGTREVTVTTAFPHLLDVGIPIRVSGTKELTADGSYIINATPSPTTFTYLSRANQNETISIFDLYTSIITGEFFQGSQISISDSEGVTTDGIGPNSTLTVKTSNKHGFGNKTPFYFLNLNSTVSQEFEAQNSTTLSFDPTNSATAQTFDGSNTLLQTPIDLSNSATTSIYQNSITSTDAQNATITINIASGDEDNWDDLNYGDPLYHDVNVGSGYFQSNPRGVVFIKDVDGIDTENNTATFQVSELPDGDPIPILANMTGYFQIASEAKTFAGNNVNSETQISIDLIKEEAYDFDGANVGYAGELEGDPPFVVSTVIGYTGNNVTIFTSEGDLDYYVGAMLQYETDGTPPSELSNQGSYFVTSFSSGESSGIFNLEIAELPGQSPISFNTTGSGTQTFSRIGVSLDKDIVHVRDSNFEPEDMLEYSFPENGQITYDTDAPKTFFFVDIAYDSHNYKLNDDVGFKPMEATGGDVVTEIFDQGRIWKVHTFNSVGTNTFSVQSTGNEDANEITYLLVAGGGGGGTDLYQNRSSGGGGGGGVLYGTTILSSSTEYSVVVGEGGDGASSANTSDGVRGSNGGNSSAFGLTAIGGGGGAGHTSSGNVTGRDGGSGGGATHAGSNFGSGTAGQGTDGRAGNGSSNSSSTTGKDGESYNIIGTSIVYGGGGAGSRAGQFVGGGGGGANGAVTRGTFQGGLGGGGNSVNTTGVGRGQDGQSGTGGGGGASRETVGADGGSGVVIIRYPISELLLEESYLQTSGGTESFIEQDGTNYVVRTFSSVGTDSFEVISESPYQLLNEVEYLIVGAGGNGGSTTNADCVRAAGGGGGGGVLTGSTSVSQQTYSINVGGPGTGHGRPAPNNGSPADSGENSSAFGLVALGGGGGAASRLGRDAGDGGSGGGAAATDSGASGSRGLGTAGQGGNGGTARCDGGGGGGGAGPNNGSNSPGNGRGGNGGNGRVSSITGTNVTYGGGGGGAGNASARGNGGAGGGGRGAVGGSGATNGTNGLGGGGGGFSESTKGVGGDGGSGVVIIRHPVAPPE